MITNCPRSAGSATSPCFHPGRPCMRYDALSRLAGITNPDTSRLELIEAGQDRLAELDARNERDAGAR